METGNRKAWDMEKKFVERADGPLGAYNIIEDF